MGLIDFAKDVGRQIFDRDDVAAEKIKQHLDIKLSGIEGLDVSFDDGVATLCGNCTNEATRNSAILQAGNIKGVEKVVADELTYPEPKAEEEKDKVEFYEIVEGDTLGAIAQRFYDDASKYVKIYEANRDLISDPDNIYPGQKIKIPRD
jgi:nucleoid-associated protein YgaU